MSRLERFSMLILLALMAAGSIATAYWTRAMVVTTSSTFFPGAMGAEGVDPGQHVPLRPLGPLPPQHKLGTPTPWDQSPLNPNAGTHEPPRHDL